MKSLGKTFGAFSNTFFSRSHFGGGLPQLIPHTVINHKPFCFSENLTVTPMEVIHGNCPLSPIASTILLTPRI
jgi:hypothetical protein